MEKNNPPQRCAMRSSTAIVPPMSTPASVNALLGLRQQLFLPNVRQYAHCVGVHENMEQQSRQLPWAQLTGSLFCEDGQYRSISYRRNGNRTIPLVCRSSRRFLIF